MKKKLEAEIASIPQKTTLCYLFFKKISGRQIKRQSKQAYSKCCQTSKMELFAKIANGCILQTHHVYCTLKRLGNNVSMSFQTWNTCDLFVGYKPLINIVFRTL